MSLKIEELDMDNLTDDEMRYLRERPWLPQPPGDEPEVRGPNDWDEDDVEVVGVTGALESPRAQAVNKGGEPVTSSAVPAGADDGNDNLDDAPDYESMTVPELKELCREAELPVSGKHDELVRRLQEYDELQANED